MAVENDKECNFSENKSGTNRIDPGLMNKQLNLSGITGGVDNLEREQALQLILKQPGALECSIDRICSAIEKEPEFFYFNKELAYFPDYYRNLVRLNRILNIDDLVFDNLARLQEQQSRESSENILSIFHHLIRNKPFSRTVLKQIFYNVLYPDFTREGQLIKYALLAKVIQQYKMSDEAIEQHQAKVNTNGGQMGLAFYEQNLNFISKVSEENCTDGCLFEYTKDSFDCFHENEDISKDNVQVLANLIWENTFFIIRNYVEKQSKPMALEVAVDGISSTDEQEISCILSLYTTIVSCTGRFFENRVMKHISIFEQLDELAGYSLFRECIAGNFPKLEASKQ